jgi:hypothetical protein
VAAASQRQKHTAARAVVMPASGASDGDSKRQQSEAGVFFFETD